MSRDELLLALLASILLSAGLVGVMRSILRLEAELRRGAW